jgi:hypothetical protein
MEPCEVIQNYVDKDLEYDLTRGITSLTGNEEDLLERYPLTEESAASCREKIGEQYLFDQVKPLGSTEKEDNLFFETHLTLKDTMVKYTNSEDFLW